MSIAVLWVSLTTVICVLRLGCRCVADNLHSLVGRRDTIVDITIDLFLIFLVYFRIGQQRLQVRESSLELGDEEQDATDKGRLMNVENLDHPLHESLDTTDVVVVLERPEEQIQVQRLLRRGDQPRVQEGLIEGPVEPINSQMLRGGELLYQDQRLHTRVKVGRMCDPEQGVQMLLQSGIVRGSEWNGSVDTGEDSRDKFLGRVKLGPGSFPVRFLAPLPTPLLVLAGLVVEFASSKDPQGTRLEQRHKGFEVNPDQSICDSRLLCAEDGLVQCVYRIVLRSRVLAGP